MRDSDSYDESYYQSRIRDEKKNYWKKKHVPIKLFAKITENFLTKVYKSKVVTFKLDEDPLHRRICFLTFMESPDMIFSQYKENCEVLLVYPTIGGEDMKYIC